MSPDTVFAFFNAAVLPAWLLLAIAPRWVWTGRIVHAVWIPCAIALAYAWAFLAGGDPPDGGGFSSLEGVMILFTSPYAVLAGWLHYLAFDLFVGAWEVRDAQRRGIGHVWVIPCLFFTLMLGPLGLALYLGLRLALVREAGLAEQPAV